MNKIVGVVHEVKDIVSGTSGKGNPWQKLTLIVDIGSGKKKNLIPVDFWGDNVDKAASLRIQDHIEVFYDLKGREWNGKIFLNVEGSAVNIIREKPMDARKTTPIQQEVFPSETYTGSLPADDDLPF